MSNVRTRGRLKILHRSSAAAKLSSEQRAPPQIGKVARNALKEFSEFVHPEALRIITPFPEQVPLEHCRLNPGLRQIIEEYEPEVVNGGLYRHQADFLNALAAKENGDFIMTTATGTGKSLCFWAWVLERLRKDPSATALLCFPTQSLMWSQAERISRLSDEESLRFPGGKKPAYSGMLRIGGQPMGWTIWQGVGYGSTRNQTAAEHQHSSPFESARIRITTLDKAHWSLFQKPTDKDFASRLR
jgi:DEAD/DEAH box helicase